MLSVILALLFVLAVAGALVALVAAPHVRSGRSLLTPDGKESIARAAVRARDRTEAVAHGTRTVVGGARAGTAQVLRPVSASLHAHLDRLEERDRAVQAEVERERAGLMHLRPRPMPEESGPIPQVRGATPPEGEGGSAG